MGSTVQEKDKPGKRSPRLRRIRAKWRADVGQSTAECISTKSQNLGNEPIVIACDTIKGHRTVIKKKTGGDPVASLF